jgi:uncharacterized protein (DUF2237 family)
MIGACVLLGGLEAYEANCAPKIYLTKTHEKTLELVPLKVLKAYAHRCKLIYN